MYTNFTWLCAANWAVPTIQAESNLSVVTIEGCKTWGLGPAHMQRPPPKQKFLTNQPKRYSKHKQDTVTINVAMMMMMVPDATVLSLPGISTASYTHSLDTRVGALEAPEYGQL
jgi:hypothetical protein